MDQRSNQRPLMTDGANGSTLTANPALQVLILFQIGLELEAELRNQNWLLTQQSVFVENEMRELRDMAAGLKDAVASLRKDAATAKDAFHSEFNRAQSNTAKFKAFTTELSDANKEVEAFLGETGSNFPTSEDSSTPLVKPKPVTDINGVTLNPDYKK